MGNTIEDILDTYCEIQGIELINKDEVLNKIEDELDTTVSNVVHDMGKIK